MENTSMVVNKGAENVLIRDFRKSDLNDLLDVASQSFAEEFEVTGFDPERVREMVDRMFGIFGRLFFGFSRVLGKEPLKLFVAEVDNRVVGMTMVNNRRKVCHIANVMVHPTYRKKGIATKLMKNALNYVQRKKGRAVLHVLSKNTPAKSLYTKLGFKKFENITYMVGDIDSLLKPKNAEEIQIRPFQKSDINEVYDLIRVSEDPNHLKIFDFTKNDLKTPLLTRIFHFSTEKKIVAIQDDRLVGYANASYTTQKEAGHIGNVNVRPENRSSGIETALINAAINQIRQCETERILATVSAMRQEQIEALINLGFRRRLEVEGMFSETLA
jgi:ribosomal protein S18 acetylase RimI-like enzyme